MIILLFLFFVFLTIITYLLFGRDIIAPSFVFCAMYTFSIGCALVNYQFWGLDIITNQLFNIYFFGAIIFIVIGMVCKFLFARRFVEPSVTGLKKINVNQYFTVFMILVNIFSLIVWIVNVYKIAGGGSSFSSIMESFRLKTSYGFQDNMPSYAEQLSKVITVSGYMYCFIYINNLIVSNQKKFFDLSLINPIIYIVFSLFSSNRLNILNFIATTVIYYCLLKNVEIKLKKGSMLLIVKLMLLFLTVMLFFYGIRLLVGRLESTNSNLIEYITKYAGGPVKLFDLYLQNPIHSSIWGQQTFVSINQLFRKLNMFNIPEYLANKEFRTFNGFDLGNVYSAYRNWYEDFGYGGCLLMQGFFSLFFNGFYYKLIGSNYYDKSKLGLIIYGYLSCAIFLHPIDDEFFRIDISIGFIIYLVVFWVLYVFLIKKINVRLQ
ncbi:O-antigen polymerase [Liquorilactobacillus nagelii]|uniref:O-antigen polymerase n=1 Tax=Liquorilactobacillus nagelii TaxID=82688 RepID=UPI001CC96FA0|nr:O-antigen polymerase [Liquorilactobacillus nagelii]ULQ49405.1 oligosaccharide repeat unit polymerase [Liquorilactobacillus nagelii]